MNDLDKRLNTDLDLSSSSSGTLAGHARHANLLGSPVSEDNLPGHSSSAWLIAGSNKTTSDNGSFGRSGKLGSRSIVWSGKMGERVGDDLPGDRLFRVNEKDHTV